MAGPSAVGGGGGGGSVSRSSAPSSSGPSKVNKTGGTTDGGNKGPQKTAAPGKSPEPTPTKTPASKETVQGAREVAAAKDKAAQQRIAGETKQPGAGEAYADRMARAPSIDQARKEVETADKRLTQAKQDLAALQKEKGGLQDRVNRLFGGGETLDKQIQSAKDWVGKSEKELIRAQGRYADAEAAARFKNQQVPGRPQTQNTWPTGPNTLVDKSGVKVGVQAKVGPLSVGVEGGPSGVRPIAGLSKDQTLARVGPFGVVANGGVGQDGVPYTGVNVEAGPFSAGVKVTPKGIEPVATVKDHADIGLRVGPIGVEATIGRDPHVEPWDG